MKHLIIGAGHMGKTYAAILRKLGQKVEMVDLEFKPLKYDRAHDSVLVCTPAETHKKILHDLPSMPTFCEKPLFVDTKIGVKYYPNQPSLLACNWLWCPHLPETKNLVITNTYPSKSKYWAWDLIHYWTLFVHRHAEPDDATSFVGGTLARIALKAKDITMIAAIYNEGKTSCCVGYEKIHSRPCSMYYEQMKHWLDVLRGTTSVNPIEKSLLHHVALGNLLNRGPALSPTNT